MAMAGLIVGLGNPGPQYALTRHNLGFLAIDALLECAGRVSQLGKSGFKADIWQGCLPGSHDTWLFAKPQTFMNLSGEAVQPLAAWYRIEPARILVIHDEVDLPPGRMKCKQGGGNAGHNGLKSLTERLGTPDFWRLRLGVGRSPHAGQGDPMVNWVLGRLTEADLALFTRMTPALRDVVCAFAAGDTTRAVRLANGYKDEA